MNPKFKFFAKKKNENGEVYLYGDIGGGLFGDGITAKMLVDSLKDLKSKGAKDLCIFINSGGGSVFDGMAMYSAIKRWEGKKTVCVDGLAASAASVVAMAADTIKMSDAAMMMVHEPSGIAVGTMKEMEDTKSRLEKIRDSMVAVYVGRTGKDEATIKQMMADETWMTATEAIDQGFADELFTSEADVAMRAVASAFLSNYRNVPESIRAAAREPPPQEKKKMDFTLLLRALGLPADASEAQAIKVVDDLRAASNTSDARHKSIHAELDEVIKLTGKPSVAEAKGVFLAWRQSQDQVAKLIAEKELAEATARAQEVKVTVDTAVREGKIPPSMKTFWEAEGNKSLETLKSYVAMAPKIVGAGPGPVIDPVPVDPAARIELSQAEQDKIFQAAGITDPKQKEALLAKVREQNVLLAKHGIKLPNGVIPA